MQFDEEQHFRHCELKNGRRYFDHCTIKFCMKMKDFEVWKFKDSEIWEKLHKLTEPSTILSGKLVTVLKVVIKNDRIIRK